MLVHHNSKTFVEIVNEIVFADNCILKLDNIKSMPMLYVAQEKNLDKHFI